MSGEKNHLLNEHRGRIVGGLIGLITALIFVIFGFWQGLFIIFLVLAGTFLGSRVELRSEFKNFLSGLWHGRKR